jgi:hypothetical protein
LQRNQARAAAANSASPAVRRRSRAQAAAVAAELVAVVGAGGDNQLPGKEVRADAVHRLVKQAKNPPVLPKVPGAVR